jgi:single-stranded-DNA-specific exonuclease
MVPLKGINRTLTRTGLDLLNSRPRPGFQALITACGIHHSPITSDDIAFRLAPRINAAGRMAHAMVAFDLLVASSLNQAIQLAQTLNELNQRRQGVENEILDRIIARLESRPELLNSKSLLVADEGWHEGVLGIVASKLASRYHKPVMVIATQDGAAKGSARSIPQVDLYAALSQCEGLLNRFGGHRLAAGLSLPTQNITRLKKEFEQAVRTMTNGKDFHPKLNVDCEIQFDDIRPELIDELENLAPYGTDNAAPLFMAKGVQVKSAAIVGRRHRRMTLYQPHQTRGALAAMHFNLMPDTPRAEVFDRMAFRLQWNRYTGTRQAQLIVEAT